MTRGRDGSGAEVSVNPITLFAIFLTEGNDFFLFFFFFYKHKENIKIWTKLKTHT